MLKPIPQTFRRWGYTGQILKREGNVVLAEKHNDITPDHKYYEVMVLQVHNGFEIAGKIVPPSEYLPHGEQWGQAGWSCQDLTHANEVFRREVGNHQECP